MSVSPELKRSDPTATGTAAHGVPGWLVALFAVASGMTVANLYYAQPLLSSLRDVFHVGTAAAADSSPSPRSATSWACSSWCRSATGWRSAS
ncbi:hypothetical protein ACFQ51_02595 [Streptomyces kaempferi]